MSKVSGGRFTLALMERKARKVALGSNREVPNKESNRSNIVSLLNDYPRTPMRWQGTPRTWRRFCEAHWTS